ncbi:MAG: DUF4416 family protein [Acidobacteria bacterium]|nr:DUF4416 family protein [Acidobacteriota bacterium]
MGIIGKPADVRFFCGVLLNRDLAWETVRELLERELGAIGEESPAYPFDSTDYYRDETGDRVDRRFVTFRSLAAPDTLADLKIRTNRLEEGLATSLGSPWPRPVNLDPGYVEPAKLVLASTKNFYHRVYLRDGIWAEVTLHFQAGAWRTFPWTFPDFAAETYHGFFREIREQYRRELRALRKPPRRTEENHEPHEPHEQP